MFGKRIQEHGVRVKTGISVIQCVITEISAGASEVPNSTFWITAAGYRFYMYTTTQLKIYPSMTPGPLSQHLALRWQERMQQRHTNNNRPSLQRHCEQSRQRSECKECFAAAF